MYPTRNSRLSRAARSPFKTMAVVVVGFIVVLAIGALATGYFNKETVQFTVKEKDAVTVRDGDYGSKNEYRIYTDKGTFVVKDSLIYTRFDSADEYARLDRGKTYRCQAYGFRLPFFSKFKNLLDCKEAHNG